MTDDQIPPDGPWFKSSPEGIPYHPNLSGRPVHIMLSESSNRCPDRPAIHFLGRSITYRELDNLVSRAARGLQDLGVNPGVHVGLYLPNSPHCIISFMAVL